MAHSFVVIWLYCSLYCIWELCFCSGWQNCLLSLHFRGFFNPCVCDIMYFSEWNGMNGTKWVALYIYIYTYIYIYIYIYILKSMWQFLGLRVRERCRDPCICFLCVEGRRCAPSHCCRSVSKSCGGKLATCMHTQTHTHTYLQSACQVESGDTAWRPLSRFRLFWLIHLCSVLKNAYHINFRFFVFFCVLYPVQDSMDMGQNLKK